jgi:hypothetical protein
VANRWYVAKTNRNVEDALVDVVLNMVCVRSYGC